MPAMEIMMEETFGPVVGIMKVESDDEALALMNDSPYGLVSAQAPFRTQLMADFVRLDLAHRPGLAGCLQPLRRRA
jgi:hypothetical protein